MTQALKATVLESLNACFADINQEERYTVATLMDPRFK